MQFPFDKSWPMALALTLIIGVSSAAVAQAALQTEYGEPGVNAGIPVTRIYLVKSTNATIIALRDTELDAPAVVRRMGNTMNVQYKGSKLDVESTIILRGNIPTVLDRYLPSDDLDE